MGKKAKLNQLLKMPKIANLIFVCDCKQCKANKNNKSTKTRNKIKRLVNKRIRKGAENNFLLLVLN